MSSSKYTPNPEIPYGYCQCGCGQKTTLASRVYKARNLVKGQPSRYLRGHQLKSPLSPTSQFWDNVDKSGGDDACWLWTKRKDRDGYGALMLGKKHMIAHRMAYQLVYGDIPAGLEVCHNCPGGDNPSCVNPAHLWLGTHKENMVDKERKGRGNHGNYSTNNQNGMQKYPEKVARGSAHPGSKLTESDVVTIRSKFTNGDNTQLELQREFKVSKVTIYRIINRIGWKHVP